MVTTITVNPLGGDVYEVAVLHNGVDTVHRVQVTEAERERFGGPDAGAEILLQKSFEFLLEREPNTAILRSFALSDILAYFPEYEREIHKRLGVSSG